MNIMNAFPGEANQQQAPQQFQQQPAPQPHQPQEQYQMPAHAQAQVQVQAQKLQAQESGQPSSDYKDYESPNYQPNSAQQQYTYNYAQQVQNPQQMQQPMIMNQQMGLNQQQNGYPAAFSPQAPQSVQVVNNDSRMTSPTVDGKGNKKRTQRSRNLAYMNSCYHSKVKRSKSRKTARGAPACSELNTDRINLASGMAHEDLASHLQGLNLNKRQKAPPKSQMGFQSAKVEPIRKMPMRGVKKVEEGQFSNKMLDARVIAPFEVAGPPPKVANKDKAADENAKVKVQPDPHDYASAYNESDPMAQIRIDQNATNDDVLCDICLEDDDAEGDEIVICETCMVGVHQHCYGSELCHGVPLGEWNCARCTVLKQKQGQIKCYDIKCFLCPDIDGAMKQIKGYGEDIWAHSVCVNWTPEIWFTDEARENINGLIIPKSRFDIKCIRCKGKTGCCIQCDFKTCGKSYHVRCAVRLELIKTHEEMQEEIGNPLDDSATPVFCRAHHKEGAKIYLKSGNDGLRSKSAKPNKKQKAVFDARESIDFSNQKVARVLRDLNKPKSASKSKKSIKKSRSKSQKKTKVTKEACAAKKKAVAKKMQKSNAKSKIQAKRVAQKAKQPVKKAEKTKSANLAIVNQPIMAVPVSQMRPDDPANPVYQSFTHQLPDLMKTMMQQQPQFLQMFANMTQQMQQNQNGGDQAAPPPNQVQQQASVRRVVKKERPQGASKVTKNPIQKKRVGTRNNRVKPLSPHNEPEALLPFPSPAQNNVQSNPCNPRKKGWKIY